VPTLPVSAGMVAALAERMAMINSDKSKSIFFMINKLIVSKLSLNDLIDYYLIS
jgi:hypothetical protein